MRGDTSCDMSNKRDRVLSHFQLWRGKLKIRLTVEYFDELRKVWKCGEPLSLMIHLFRGSHNQRHGYDLPYLLSRMNY